MLKGSLQPSDVFKGVHLLLRLGAGLMAALLLSMSSASAQAQTSDPLRPNQDRIGEIRSDDLQPTFLLQVESDQELLIELRASSADLLLQFTVLTQSGALVQTVGNPNQSNILSSTVSFQQGGLYIIQVASANNATGRFRISILTAADGRSTAENLNLNEVLLLNISSGETLAYSITADAFDLLLLEIDGTRNAQNTQTRLLDNGGQVIGSSDVEVLFIAFSIPPGTSRYRLELHNPTLEPEPLAVILNLKRFMPRNYNLAETGTATPNPNNSALPTPRQSSLQVQLPTRGPCVLATRNNFNINVRNGPSERFDPPLTQIIPSEYYPVLGRNEDSSWYLIGLREVEGWVAEFVTRLGGDCESISVVDAPPPPSNNNSNSNGSEED